MLLQVSTMSLVRQFAMVGKMAPSEIRNYIMCLMQSNTDKSLTLGEFCTNTEWSAYVSALMEQEEYLHIPISTIIKKSIVLSQ